MAQSGFEYERNATRFLQKLDIVPKGFTPAGNAHDRPDLMIKKPDQQDGASKGAELKLSPSASAGSHVFHYDLEKKMFFMPTDDKSEEKQFIRSIAHKTNVLDEVNKKWKKRPAKFSEAGKYASSKVKYKYDYAHFPDIRGDIPSRGIEQYYQAKNTFYLNFGTHGLFLLGTSDPLHLNRANPRVPEFSRNVKSGYRARVQYKGHDNYQFVFEFTMHQVHPSPYNIAPTVSKTSPVIDKSKVSIDCFLET
jgi:hypothetical protein